MADNTVTFTVEGVGKIIAYKEPPARLGLFQRRQDLAKLVGGLTELVKIESTISTLKDSPNDADREMATRLMTDLLRFNTYINLKNCVIEPREFNVDNLNVEEFERVWSAYDRARGAFPGAGTDRAAGTPTGDVPPTQSPG